MRNPRAFLILLFVVAAGCNPALAGGQAFCRAEVGAVQAFSTRCAIEQTVFAFGNLEVLAGASLRFAAPDTVLATLYTAFILGFPDWWLEVDVVGSTSSQGAFGFALAGGFRW